RLLFAQEREIGLELGRVLQRLERRNGRAFDLRVHEKVVGVHECHAMPEGLETGEQRDYALLLEALDLIQAPHLVGAALKVCPVRLSLIDDGRLPAGCRMNWPTGEANDLPGLAHDVSSASARACGLSPGATRTRRFPTRSFQDFRLSSFMVSTC